MVHKLLLLTLLGVSSATIAQKDLTSQYIQNPSSESDAVSSLTADATRGQTAPHHSSKP